MKDGDGIINISIRNDHNEALLQWSENLAALGQALRLLNEYPDPEIVMPCVAQLGYVIEDYANMLNQVCHQAYGEIGQYFREGKHSLVYRAKETHTHLKERSFASPASIMQIDGIIEEMKPALTDALILKELLGEFEKIKKTMKQKLDAENPTQKADHDVTAAA